jgi:hypothetical protein
MWQDSSPTCYVRSNYQNCTTFEGTPTQISDCTSNLSTCGDGNSNGYDDCNGSTVAPACSPSISYSWGAMMLGNSDPCSCQKTTDDVATMCMGGSVYYSEVDPSECTNAIGSCPN